MSRNSVIDNLIATIGRWQKLDVKYLYVYDGVGYWAKSRQLYKEIQKASWDDVILNESMKNTLTELVHKFFDSEETYKGMGGPWKRGVIFHGPAGNGKTISIKALMNSLFKKKGLDIPSLYVKSAPRTYDIRAIFERARNMAPCLLVFEDIDTIITPGSKSYFFNEVDGLENNDGLFMVASTNHLDQLDPGLSNRPSRFDRKYLFPLPSEDDRVLYCDFWREKLKSQPSIKFPKKICFAIAGITQDFSFAYLKEAFVATLLTIADHRSEDNSSSGDDDGGDLDDYELWREMKKQVKLLRDDMGSLKSDSNVYTPWVSPFEEEEPKMSWKEMDESQPSKAPTVGIESPLNPASRFKCQGVGGVSQHPRTNGFTLNSWGAPVMIDGGTFLE